MSAGGREIQKDILEARSDVADERSGGVGRGQRVPSWLRERELAGR